MTQVLEDRDQWSLTFAQRVNDLCDRFERQWQQASQARTPRPRLEELLQPTEEEHATLFLELLEIELAYRRQLGEEPDRNEYEQRFLLSSILSSTVLDRAFGANGESSDLTRSELSPGSVSPDTKGRPLPSVTGYQILDQIGQGGMGTVYKAHQLQPSRPVALKVIRSVHATNEERARFQKEADTLANLNHPNIVTLYAHGEENDTPYLSLEYVKGGSLNELLRGEPQPPRDAARFVEILAQAVQVAHQANVLHRDLKPSNILIAREPLPPKKEESTDDSAVLRMALLQPETAIKITDFGLARNLSEDSDQTRQGRVLGTPSYMAPEQARGENDNLGPETDVYALGAILYELLTGRPPFKAVNVITTLEQVQNEEPVPPRRLQPGAPRDLETICLKCLRKSPQKRYPTAMALAEDLHCYLEGRPIQARPVGKIEALWKWCRRNPAFATLIPVVAFALFFLLLLGSQFLLALKDNEVIQAQRQLAEKTARAEKLFRDLSEAQQLLSQPGRRWTALELLSQIAKAPNRHLLPKNRLKDLTLQAMAQWDIRPIATLADGYPAHALAFDPNGKWLAIGGLSGKLRLKIPVLLIDLQTTKVVKELGAPVDVFWELKHSGNKKDGLRSLRFAPDGKWLIGGSRSGKLFRWNLQTLEEIPKVWNAHQAEIHYLAFNDKGTMVYTLGNGEKLKQWDIRTWKAIATYEVKTNPPKAFAIHGNKLLASRNGQLELLNPSTLKLERAVPGKGSSPALHPNIPTALVERDRALFLVDLELGKDLYELRTPQGEKAHHQPIHRLRIHPSGAIMASSSHNHRARLWDLSQGRLLADLSARKGIAQVAFHPTKPWLAVLKERSTTLYEMGGIDILKTKILAARPIKSIALSANGILACLAPHPGNPEQLDELTVWQQGSQKPLARATFSQSEQGALAIDPEGRHVAVAEDDQHLLVWDWKANQKQKKKLEGDVRTIDYSPDNRLLLTIENQLYQMDSGQRPKLLWQNLFGLVQGQSHLVKMTAGRNRELVSGDDRIVRWLVGPERDKPKTFSYDQGTIRSQALDPNEALALIGTSTGELTLAELSSAKKLSAQSEAHQGMVDAVLFVDKDRAVSGGEDGILRFWNLTSHRLDPLMQLRMPGAIRQLLFDPTTSTLYIRLRSERGIRILDLKQLDREMATILNDRR